MSLLSSRRARKTQRTTDDQPHLRSWDGNRAANPGKHFQTHEGYEIYQKQSAWIHQCLTNFIRFTIE